MSQEPALKRIKLPKEFIEELPNSFVPSIKNVVTLNDLITIGKEYSTFQKNEETKNSIHVEKLQADNKSIGKEILNIQELEKKKNSDKEDLGDRKRIFKKTIATNKIKIKAFNDTFQDTFIDTDYGRLSNIVSELEELNNMIGLSKLKDSIANQILFFIQKLNSNEMMHTAIFGSPGTGKTVTGRILGTIYTKLGYLSKGTFTVASRSDFVGKFLGHTANKTQKLLESCKGGVLFLDEAYSMGNKEEKDSFSKEAIDTINQFLSENSEDFVMVIAGYEKDVKDCFFAYNQGLERRFPWKFKMDSYSDDELKQIFEYQIGKDDWKFDDTFIESIKLKSDSFKFNGGDTLILFDKCKMAHAKRVFGKSKDVKKILTENDFKEGLKLYDEYKENKKEEKSHSQLHMYM